MPSAVKVGGNLTLGRLVHFSIADLSVALLVGAQVACFAYLNVSGYSRLSAFSKVLRQSLVISDLMPSLG